MKFKDCGCEKCKGACSYKPGWFMPGQIEKVARYLKVTKEKLFKKYLGIDYWASHDGDIFVLAPATKSMLPGEVYPFNPKGECVFFKAGKCSIHEVKPFECRSYIHTESDDDLHKRHEEVKTAWGNKKNQKQIADLYGDEPFASEPEGVGSMFGIFL